MVIGESKRSPKDNPLAVERVHNWRIHWRWEELIGQSEDTVGKGRFAKQWIRKDRRLRVGARYRKQSTAVSDCRRSRISM